jgi:hypothetical protein
MDLCSDLCKHNLFRASHRSRLFFSVDKVESKVENESLQITLYSRNDC